MARSPTKKVDISQVKVVVYQSPLGKTENMSHLNRSINDSVTVRQSPTIKINSKIVSPQKMMASPQKMGPVNNQNNQSIGNTFFEIKKR